MKSITFRPLRKIKKTGKITVASYMQWRKIFTADYNAFNLIVDPEYKSFHEDEFVFNHKGERLFWFNYNPVDIPVFNHHEYRKSSNFFETMRDQHKDYGIRWHSNQDRINYCARGLDCDGVPIFTHYTDLKIIDYFKDVSVFEPLTVKTVNHLFGWFLYNLQNSNLKIGKG